MSPVLSIVGAAPHTTARKVSRATRQANGRLAHDSQHMRRVRRRRMRRDEPAVESIERVDGDEDDRRDARNAVKTATAAAADDDGDDDGDGTRARRDAGDDDGEGHERRRTVSTQMRNERWAKTFVRWFHIDDDDDDDNGDDGGDGSGDGRGVNMGAMSCTATTNDGDGDDEGGMVREKRKRVDRRDARYDADSVRNIIACLAVHAYRYKQDIDSVRQSLDEGAGETARLMAALDDAKREADAYGCRANASDARLFTVCKKINEIIVSMRLGEAKKRGLVESLNANMAVWEKNFEVLNDDVQRAREREEVSNFAIRQLQDRMRAFEEYVDKRCNAMEATLSARLKNQEEILMEKVLMENAAANERVNNLHQAFRQEMSDKIAGVIVNIANLADKKVNNAIDKMIATVSSVGETQCTKIEHNVNEKVVRLVERKFQSERANLERVYLNNARVGRELGEMSNAIEMLFKNVPCLPSSERKK